MIHIRSIEEGLDVYKALGSDVRVQIIKLLLINQEMSINELACSLKLTNGALTSHIKKLEDSKLIEVLQEHNGHGNQKVCRVNVDKIFIEIKEGNADISPNVFDTSVKIGHYSDFHVLPTCGIATASHLIGEIDDPRYFTHAERVDAGILWFTKGYIEYAIPNLIPAGKRIEQLTISLELCSEAPGTNEDWPSDISFYLNQVGIGSWRSPGDFGDKKGIFTPDWWYNGWNQYGLLKHITIGGGGTFLDGFKISDVSVQDLGLDYRSDLKFRLAVTDEAENIGGITVFGRDFGNYNQDIEVRIGYV